MFVAVNMTRFERKRERARQCARGHHRRRQKRDRTRDPRHNVYRIGKLHRQFLLTNGVLRQNANGARERGGFREPRPGATGCKPRWNESCRNRVQHGIVIVGVGVVGHLQPDAAQGRGECWNRRIAPWNRRIAPWNRRRSRALAIGQSRDRCREY